MVFGIAGEYHYFLKHFFFLDIKFCPLSFHVISLLWSVDKSHGSLHHQEGVRQRDTSHEKEKISKISRVQPVLSKQLEKNKQILLKENYFHTAVDPCLICKCKKNKFYPNGDKWFLHRPLTHTSKTRSEISPDKERMFPFWASVSEISSSSAQSALPIENSPPCGVPHFGPPSALRPSPPSCLPFCKGMGLNAHFLSRSMYSFLVVILYPSFLFIFPFSISFPLFFLCSNSSLWLLTPT